MLLAARFGVAIWTAAESTPLAIEMINGLVRDLNETTRFSTLPSAAAGQRRRRAGGLRLDDRLSAAHRLRARRARRTTPGAIDAERLVAAGETDCVIWISAFGAPPPAWLRSVVSIALCDRARRGSQAPHVRSRSDGPGVDHDAVAAFAPTPAPSSRSAASRAERGAERRRGARAHRRRHPDASADAC